MKKKRRSEVLKEGKIYEIMDKFFLLGKTWPEDHNMDDILDLEFCVDDRVINKHISKKGFVVKGLNWTQGGTKIQGLGCKIVKEGQRIFVRHDKKTPNIIDIEFWAGQGGEDQVYTIDRDEWIRINPFLKRWTRSSLCQKKK